MKVELLTPLHIGTGNEVPDFEYVLNGNQLLHISLPSLLTADAGAAEALSELATRNGVMNYLKNRRGFWGNHLLYPLNGECVDFDRARKDRASKDDLSVRECVKASFGHFPLLPGSSLKGAMLTGWLFGVGWEELAQADRDKLLQASSTDFEIKLDHQLYERLTRNNPEWGLKSKAEKPNLLSDRLWVSDIELDGGFEMRQAQRTIKRHEKSHTLTTWIECVAAGATGEMLGRFREEPTEGGRTVAELCRRCNIFARCLLVAEQQFADYCIGKSYFKARPAAYADNGLLLARLTAVEQTPDTCLVRIGWASNKNAASLTLMNSSANLSGQPLSRERRRPKSRWSLKDSTPFGWCLVTFEEGDYE